MLKKLVSFTVALIMIFSCMSIVVSAEDAIPEIEPNDDIDTAQVIEPNCTITGVIPATDYDSEELEFDVDAFKFTLTERSKIVITLTSSTNMVIPIIIDELGEEMYMPEIDYEAEELPEEMILTEYLKKGTYFVVISDVFGSLLEESENTTYTFTITRESAVQTLKKEGGVWRYYVGGKFSPETTLVKYKGEWFYIENGVWNKKATTLTKYEDMWFYVQNGKWRKTTTTLAKYEGQWFYIKNGKWDRYAKTLVKYSGKWFYVKNGKWNKATTIVKYSGKKFYVKGGIAQLSFSGTKKIGGQTYFIKNGKVV